MDQGHHDFLGEWQQVEPDASPLSVTVDFQKNGRMTWAIAQQGQPIELGWRVEGSNLIVAQPESGEENASRFRFESPSILVVEFGKQTFVYRRFGGDTLSA